MADITGQWQTSQASGRHHRHVADIICQVADITGKWPTLQAVADITGKWQTSQANSRHHRKVSDITSNYLITARTTLLKLAKRRGTTVPVANNSSYRYLNCRQARLKILAP
jgi:hypothetical protein